MVSDVMSESRKKLSAIFLEKGGKIPSDGILNECMSIMEGRKYAPVADSLVKNELYELIEFLQNTSSATKIKRIDLINHKNQRVSIKYGSKLYKTAKAIFDLFAYLTEEDINRMEKDLPIKPNMSKIPEEKIKNQYLRDTCKKLYDMITKEYPHLQKDDKYRIIGKVLYNRGVLLFFHGKPVNPFKHKGIDEEDSFLGQIRNKIFNSGE